LTPLTQHCAPVHISSVPPHAFEFPATQIVRMPQSLSHAHAVWQVSLVSHAHVPALVQSGSHAQPAWQALDVSHAQPPVVTQCPPPVSHVRPGSQPPPGVQAQPSDPIEQLPPSSARPLPPPPQPPSTSATKTTILMTDAVSRLRGLDNISQSWRSYADEYRSRLRGSVRPSEA
jgi:hypothetical protein